MVVRKYKFFNKKFLAKTVTWKLIDGVVTFTLCYILTGEFLISVNLAVLEVIVESIVYYFHEHAWSRTDWGEYKMEDEKVKQEEKTVHVHWKDTEKPELISATKQEVFVENSELKGWLVNYVGQKCAPKDDNVTVGMIVETIAKEFPEFLLTVAEENWVRGYQQALDDVEVGQSMSEEDE